MKVTFEPLAGSDIRRTINSAIVGALDNIIEFEFNGVTVQVTWDSDPDLIYRDWSRAMSGYITGTVGPHPAQELTPADLENDARIGAENEARRAAESAEYEAQEAAKTAATRARLATAPPIDLSDPAGWKASVDANPDSYGSGVIRYAEAWARLMQAGIAEGAALEDIADETSHAADTEGITGFMYGAAVATLAAVWVHGDQLRKWHNRRHGVSDDRQGTVNPAVITISAQED